MHLFMEVGIAWFKSPMQIMLYLTEAPLITDCAHLI